MAMKRHPYFYLEAFPEGMSYDGSNFEIFGGTLPWYDHNMFGTMEPIIFNTVTPFFQDFPKSRGWYWNDNNTAFLTTNDDVSTYNIDLSEYNTITFHGVTNPNKLVGYNTSILFHIVYEDTVDGQVWYSVDSYNNTSNAEIVAFEIDLKNDLPPTADLSKCFFCVEGSHAAFLGITGEKESNTKGFNQLATFEDTFSIPNQDYFADVGESWSDYPGMMHVAPGKDVEVVQPEFNYIYRPDVGVTQGNMAFTLGINYLVGCLAGMRFLDPSLTPISNTVSRADLRDISADVTFLHNPSIGLRAVMKAVSDTGVTLASAVTPAALTTQPYKLRLNLTGLTPSQKETCSIYIYLRATGVDDSVVDGNDVVVDYSTYLIIDNVNLNDSRGMTVNTMANTIVLNQVNMSFKERLHISTAEYAYDFRGQSRLETYYNARPSPNAYAFYPYSYTNPGFDTFVGSGVNARRKISVETKTSRFRVQFSDDYTQTSYSNSPKVLLGLQAVDTWPDPTYNFRDKLKTHRKIVVKFEYEFLGGDFTAHQMVPILSVFTQTTPPSTDHHDNHSILNGLTSNGSYELSLDLSHLSEGEIDDIKGITIGFRPAETQDLDLWINANTTHNLYLESMSFEIPGPILAVGSSLPIDTASYTYDLKDVDLLAKKYMSISTASYASILTPVGLSKAKVLNSDTVSYTMSMSDVGSKLDYKLSIDTAPFVLTFNPMGQQRERKLNITAPAQFVLNLRDVGSISTGVRIITPLVGSFNIKMLTPVVSSGSSNILPAPINFTISMPIPSRAGEMNEKEVVVPAMQLNLHMPFPTINMGSNNHIPLIRVGIRVGTPGVYNLTTISCQGDTYPEEHIEDSKKLDSDAYIDLFELHMSGVSSALYLTLNSDKQWSGKNYEGYAIKLSGVSKSSDDENSRPKLALGNPDGVFSYLVNNGMLENATLKRIRILKQHLDNNQPIYRIQQWRVSRVVSVVDGVIVCELRSMLDGPNFLTPARMFIPPDFPAVSLN